MAVMETLKDKASAALSSAGEINKLTIDKIEEVSRLNLATAKYLSDVTIRQLRALAGINSLESFQKFTADSVSVSGEIAKKILDDSKAWMSVGADVKEKVTDLFAKKEEVPVHRKSTAKADNGLSARG